MAKPIPRLSPTEIEAIIKTAWDDRPPFRTVLMQHGIEPGQVVQLLKRELTSNAFKVWTARTKGVVSAAPARYETPKPKPKPKPAARPVPPPKPPPKPAAKAAPKPPAKPATQPATKAATKAATQRATQPATKPVR